MRKIIKHIRMIEKKCYPSQMRCFQNIKNISDLHEYCESDNVNIETTSHGYLIYTQNEVVDIASTSTKEALFLLRKLAAKCRNKPMKLDARESTSYPIIMALSQKNRLDILYSNQWTWDNEIMYEMEIIIK